MMIYLETGLNSKSIVAVNGRIPLTFNSIAPNYNKMTPLLERIDINKIQNKKKTRESHSSKKYDRKMI